MTHVLNSLERGDRVLVVSPHLDDGVLSAGGFIDWAVQRGVDVTVGTIFTADAPPPSALPPLAKELHQIWRAGDNPYAARRQEDAVALNILGAALRHGNLPDSIYRTDHDGQALYGSRESIFFAPAATDPAREPLLALISNWINEARPHAVLAPLAVGRHIDHQITTETMQRGFARWNVPVFLYEDFPYATGRFPIHLPDSVAKARDRSAWKITQCEAVAAGVERKLAALRAYASQLPEIFSGRDMEADVKDFMAGDRADGFEERFWRVEGVS